VSDTKPLGDSPNAADLRSMLADGPFELVGFEDYKPGERITINMHCGPSGCMVERVREPDRD
jgi:hypothetical protein